MTYSMTAQLKDGNLVDLVQCEFVGSDELKTLEDAIEAAETAMDYSDEIAEIIVRSDNGYEGSYDANGWHAAE